MGRSIGPSTFFFPLLLFSYVRRRNWYNVICTPYSVLRTQYMLYELLRRATYNLRIRIQITPSLGLLESAPEAFHPCCVCCYCTAAYGNIASTFCLFSHFQYLLIPLPVQSGHNSLSTPPVNPPHPSFSRFNVSHQRDARSRRVALDVSIGLEQGKGAEEKDTIG